MTSSINFAVPFNLFKFLVLLVLMQRTLYLDFAFLTHVAPYVDSNLCYVNILYMLYLAATLVMFISRSIVNVR